MSQTASMLTTMAELAERRKRDAFTKYLALLQKKTPLSEADLIKAAGYLQDAKLSLAWHDVFQAAILAHDTAETEAAKLDECQTAVVQTEAAHQLAIKTLTDETARLEGVIEARRAESYGAKLRVQIAAQAATLAATLQTMFGPLFSDGGIEDFKLPLDAQRLPLVVRNMMVNSDLIDPKTQSPIALTEPPRPKPDLFIRCGQGAPGAFEKMK
jgi:hypothetical protein